MTMDEYMQTLVEWHKSLIFMSSMSKEVDSSSSTITIALPPGIQNLGATCYLNTQLQCLAQNPVFLDGIFSWRPVNSTHMMNGVMEQLQKLLADMQVGGDNKYTSLDFSNALGIQHNEQQDPNEFARLLFDRMEESFQQCSVNSSVAGSSHENSSNENGLGKLLQRIFHGTTTYETICMKCGKTSVRSEGFMDLNLPIVQRQHFEEDETDDADNIESNNGGEKDGQAFVKRKRRKKGMLEKAFEKQRKNSLGDTDVQYCFDQYTKPETLDGDNQYFCDACNCKQDAKRVMTLTELPPVLNIQLSRYVFDREKFIKKKLTDKVRLPTVLRIDQHSKGAGANAAFVSNRASKKNQNLKKKYLLCAVMRHQGTSAYSGHYVAEAMDWTIGQWYEFNDETVKVLTAPSNSYVPHDYLDLEDENIKNESMTVGSQDAYNMYYVDEEYLGKNAITTMCRIKGLNSIQNREKIHESNGIDELRRKLIVDKINDYAFLTK
jgi:ubiquitin carboxyl-terminal hydrolase 48